MSGRSRKYPLKRIIWIYNLDGKSKFFKIKGKDKRYFKKLRRREEKKFVAKVIDQELN
jgi:hypothetical protein